MGNLILCQNYFPGDVIRVVSDGNHDEEWVHYVRGGAIGIVSYVEKDNWDDKNQLVIHCDFPRVPSTEPLEYPDGVSDQCFLLRQIELVKPARGTHG